MRTKDEVLAYLKETGHSNNAVTKIMGFLIGNGMKEPDEKIIFKRGQNSWEEFYEWFENKYKKEECPLYNLMSYLNDRLNETNDPAEEKRINGFMRFLVSEFVLDVSAQGEEVYITGFDNKCTRKRKSR